MNTKEEIQKNFENLSKNFSQKIVDNNWTNASPLFAFIGEREDYDAKYDRGCLTQIKTSSVFAPFIGGKVCNELKEEIINDPRIPKGSTLITSIEDLEVFKEYQERVVDMQEAGHYIPKQTNI